MHTTSASTPASAVTTVTDSPPRAPPIKYTAPLGTRWAKEKAAAGGSTAFDLPTDPKTIGPWILGECVGKGASGRVKIAKHRRTGQLAAVKILPVAPLVSSRASLATQQAKSERQRLGIDREITMMKLMNHPNIMRIYDVYEGEKELFLVLEYVEGGELFDFLVNRGRLSANEALIYFRQIVYGLNYAHTFSIIHRDLKPENILIASLSPPQLKIADWGMAAFAPPSLQLETSCGSPHYASPEIVNGEKYEGNATDIWSCGVILYALLTGRLPFDDKNVRTLLSKVKSGKYEMPTWIDPLAKDLLSKMLVVDVKQRITIPEILAHPWLTTLPDIIFTDSAGQIHTIHPPPLPPSPTLLGRPICFPASQRSSETRSLTNANFSVSPTPFNTNTSLHTQSLPQPHSLVAQDPKPDPELLASLQIIWGRHADPAGDAILRELSAPPGEGTHAKAFYFLLGKYREERGKYREAGWQGRAVGNGGMIDLETLKFNLGWELDETLAAGEDAHGLRKYEVPRAQPAGVQRVGGAADAPSYSANLASGGPSRKRTLTDGTAGHPHPPPHATHATHAHGVSASAGAEDHSHPHTAHTAAQTGTGPHAGANTSTHAHAMVSARGKLSLGAAPPPRALRPAPRRGMTHSTVEGRERGRAGEAGAIGFSQHLQNISMQAHGHGHGQRPTSAAVYAGVVSASPPTSGTGRGGEPIQAQRPARQPLSPIMSPNPGAYQSPTPAMSRTQSANQEQNLRPGQSPPVSGASPGTIISVGSLDLPLLAGRPRGEERAQTQTASQLVQSVMGTPAPAGAPVLAGGPQDVSHMHVRGHAEEKQRERDTTKGKVGGDKENQSTDEESWSHVNGEADRSLGVGLGVGVAGVAIGAGNRDVGRDVVNVGAAMLELGKAKKDKEKKARPPPLELPTVHHKRSAFGILGSPIALASPIHHPHPPSSANRILASPVVGEFKGWFSNLFSWKHSSAHGGLLYSTDDLPRTRANVVRVLESLGVTLTSTPVGEPPQSLQEQAEVQVLACRVDHPTVDRETGLALKIVRFRVELRAPVDYQQSASTCTGTPLSPGDDTPGTAQSPYFLAAPPPATPSLLVTPTSATPAGASRARASMLLGRSATAPAPGGNWELPPGCACAVALVHEKGSMSTFKAVWRRLKDECVAGTPGADASSGSGSGAGSASAGSQQAYAFFSPVMPGTPYVDSQRLVM